MPLVKLAGLTENDAPLQMVVVMRLITAFAFTNMVAVKAVPAQSTPSALNIGVT